MIEQNVTGTREKVRQTIFLILTRIFEKGKTCAYVIMNKSWSSTSETPNSNGKRSGFPLSITPEKRRKISTKNCQECLICSDEVFEVRLVKFHNCKLFKIPSLSIDQFICIT